MDFVFSRKYGVKRKADAAVRMEARLAFLNILSAGAAQAVVEQVLEQFRQERAAVVNADYGAVGAIKARILAAEPVDIVILTATLIDELIALGVVVPGSRRDLGQVGTAIAVRAGMACPKIDTPTALRSSLLAASRIICPDPAVATAGKVLLEALGELGILEQVRSRLEYTQSGFAAVARLAQGTAPLEIGVVQVTEVRASKAVIMAGPMPANLQRVVTYSLGLATGARETDCARDFMECLAGHAGRSMLSAAGFDVSPGSIVPDRTVA